MPRGTRLLPPAPGGNRLWRLEESREGHPRCRRAFQCAGYRTLRYDLYGRGWSDRPAANYDGSLYDGQLGELLESLQVTDPIDLVGLSFGGFVTAHFVAAHRSRVRTLTLVDPMSRGIALPTLLRLPVFGPWYWQTRLVPAMADNQETDLLHPEHYPTWSGQFRDQTRFRDPLCWGIEDRDPGDADMGEAGPDGGGDPPDHVRPGQPANARMLVFLAAHQSPAH